MTKPENINQIYVSHPALNRGRGRDIDEIERGRGPDNSTTEPATGSIYVRALLDADL